MKYILIAVAILFILVLIPLFIPLDKYKSIIETKVGDATGRQLTINGDINLSLLPRPKVKIDGVKLSSLPNATVPQMLELESAEATIAISPLLTGKIVVSYIKLKNPKVVLEKLKNGQANWEFENKTAEVATSKQQGTNGKQAKADDLPFRVNRIIIDKGELIYIDGDVRKNLQDIDFDAKFENIKGPIDFDLACKILDQSISVNGNIKELANIIPLTVELKAQGIKVGIKGNANLNNSSFNGEVSSEGNLKNLKFISAESLPDGLKEDYKFTSKVSADKRKFESNDISFKLKDIEANGQANYSFDGATGELNIVLTPGKITLNCTPKSSTDNYIVNKIQLQADSIKPFLEALKIDVKDLPQFLSQAFSIDADLKYKDQELVVQNIGFSLGKANLQGMVGAKNWASNLSFIYDLKTKNGNALASLVGATSPINMGELQMKGELSKKDEFIQTNTTLSVAKADINIKGTVNIDKEVKPNLTINVKGNNLNQTIAELTQKSSAKRLGSFNISTAASGNLSKELKLNIEKSSITMANDTVNLNGTGNVMLGSAKTKISLNFSVSNINLDTIAGSTNSSPSPKMSSNSATSSMSKSRWSSEKIDLSFLNDFDGDLSLAVQKISSGALIFDSFKTKLTINSGVLDIASITGNLYGGKLQGSGRVATKKDGSGDISLKAALNGGQLRNIVPTEGKIKVTQGTIDFNADIKTKGDSEYSYVDNLNGTVTLNGKDGRLSGLDLQKIVRALNDAKNLQNILKSIDNSVFQGETAFKTIDSKLVIDKGVGNLVTGKVIANGGEANATGTINLPKYMLDIAAEIKVDIKNMPPFKANLYGALDSPQYKLDLKALQQYLVNNVLTNVIDSIKSGKTKPEDILKGIIGGSKSKQTQTDSQQESDNNSQNDNAPSPKNEVNKLIDKGLKGLFK